MDNASTLQNRRFVGVKETLIYGFANGGQCMSYTFMSSWLVYFFVSVFKIAPEAVSFMIFVVGIWDTINDPLMGSIIDRTRTRFGKLRPWLLIVPIPLALATVMLFSGPELLADEPVNSIKRIVYMYVSYIIWELFYTIGDVPFWGLSASISPNPKERTAAITSARFISSILGGLPGIVISPLIDLAKDGKIDVPLHTMFFIMGLVVSIVGMAIFSLAGIFVKERVVSLSDEPKFTDSMRFLFKNKPLVMIILSNVLGALGGIGGIFSTYYYIDVLGSATVSLFIGIPGTVVGFISYLMIPYFKKRWDNRQIMILTGLYTAAIPIAVYFVGIKFASNMWVIAPVLALQGALTGIVSAIRMVVPTEMIADTVDYMEWKTGKRNEGMAFSVLTFVGKLSGSIQKSIGTALLGASFVGYVIVQGVDHVPQSDATKAWIWAFFTIIPAVLGLLGIVPYLAYDLVGDKLKKIRDDLDARRVAVVQSENDGKAGE